MAKSTSDARQARNIGVRRWRQPTGRDFIRVHDIMRVGQPVALRFLQPGAVVLARISFSDSDDYKVRPVIIDSLTADGIRAHKCTTSLARLRRRELYVEISDLESAGLTRPTGIQREVLRITADLIVEVRGRLCGEDLAALLPDYPAGPVAA